MKLQAQHLESVERLQLRNLSNFLHEVSASVREFRFPE